MSTVPPADSALLADIRQLIVTGEKKIIEKVEGLGGGFTYYTLSDPLDLDKMLLPQRVEYAPLPFCPLSLRKGVIR
ncbi:MAG: hypothetical protein HC808_10760 [Candidatus Competibacteraceae bacterium]|nr:hypothetical protein [Candidatus Competibacteraceae bacterium]